MFGYVRPLRSQMNEEVWSRYQAVYCGLCHRLGELCGVPARFILNYDFVFLFLLLDSGAETEISQRRCAAHPMKGRACLAGGEMMDLCAWESVILAYYKLQDSVADEDFWHRRQSHTAARLLRRAYRKARTAQGDFDGHVVTCLRELDELERARSSQLDRVADTFARLLAGAAPETTEPHLDRPRQQLLYHLGRWIYLIDAVDDLTQDRERGRYNPVAARFGDQVDMDYMDTTMSHSLTLAQAAFQLLPRTTWSDILENILYLGLPNVQKLVISGKWKQKEDKKRERTHE